MSETNPVRPGEELNERNLTEFLCENLNLKSAEIEISQFPGGSSNLTYCVKIGSDEYVLRRPPFGNRVRSAHDMSREFNVLTKLSKVYSPAPQPLIYCGDESVIGAEFYLMERRRGVIIRGKVPETAESEKLVNSQSFRRKVVESFVGNLVKLHSLDYQKIGLGDLGKPEGYVVRQVQGWTKRYFNAKTDENAELEKAIEWINENIPDSHGASLIHNDYKFDNVMLNPQDLTEIVAVLDWEMTTIGEPLMDFGSSLAYWMSEAEGEAMLNQPFNPRVLMENISRRDLIEIYEEKSGTTASDILFYYIFGTVKLAVIAQQIYFRYVKGFTKDERFAGFGRFVNSLGKIALNAIEKEKI
jgi:aminoglycoside phosphotransferase (APT) family kinase protein